MIFQTHSKFGLETFAEAAFGLGIDVDAFGDVVIHVNSSVLRLERLGRLKSDDKGKGAGRGCGLLAAALGRVGWDSFESAFGFGSSSQGLARRSLRR
jgi:hypothetical protein